MILNNICNLTGWKVRWDLISETNIGVHFWRGSVVGAYTNPPPTPKMWHVLIGCFNIEVMIWHALFLMVASHIHKLGLRPKLVSVESPVISHQVNKKDWADVGSFCGKYHSEIYLTKSQEFFRIADTKYFEKKNLASLLKNLPEKQMRNFVWLYRQNYSLCFLGLPYFLLMEISSFSLFRHATGHENFR